MKWSHSLAAMLLALAGGSAILVASAATPPPAPAQAAPVDAPPMDQTRGPHEHGPGDMHRRGGPAGMPLLRLLRGLDLSEAQRDQIRQLLEKNREPHQALTKRRADLRRAFVDLDPVAPDYRKKADQLADEAAKLAQETIRFDARVTSDVVALLTPEQAKQLQAKLAERREHPRGNRPQD